MTQNDYRRNTSLSGGTGTYGNNFQAVVYNDFSGVPLKITNLDGRWWVTTPGERLQLLKDYFGGEDIGFNYLCEANGTVGALHWRSCWARHWRSLRTRSTKCCATEYMT